MKQIVKEFILDTLRQLLGWGIPRSGRLILTHHAFKKMREYQLDVETLKDVFLHGEEVKKDMIIRKYQNYSVGITIKDTYKDNRYVVITCFRKGGE